MAELIMRERQAATLEVLREQFRGGSKSVMLYGPTGFGKTELAIFLMKSAMDKGKRAVMILDRVALCDQTSARLDKYGIAHSVLQANHWRYRPHETIQICSAQTLETRGGFPDADLIIVDEAHTVRKQTAEFIKNSRSRVVGLSATPFTKGLANIYSSVASAVTTEELVNDSLLVGLKIFVSHEINMSGAKKVAGEWSARESSERGIKITGDVVAEWVKITHEVYGGPRKTIVFCSGVAHGADLSEKFAGAGYNFVNLSYKDDDDFKRQAIADFSKPDTKIHGLIATDILTKGFDCADVCIGVSARPFSKSFASHVQQMGRIMRAHPSKDFGVWIDHSGNYLRFKDQWDDLYQNGVTELSDGEEKAPPEPTKEEKEAAKCPACGQLWGPTDICGHCGHVRVRKNEVVAVPGSTEELNTGREKKEKFSSEVKESWYKQMLGYCKETGKKEGFAFYKYQEKFGVNPVWKKEAAPPSAEVRKWIKSRQISFAKLGVRA